MKKRLSLSLIALVGSVFLFVVASFAWFAISDIVDVNENILTSNDINVTATLYVSDDDVTYTEATSIDFQNQVPGDIKYYKIILSNNNDFAVTSQIFLYGMSEIYTDIAGDTSNYIAGYSLADMVLLNSSNNYNSDVITDSSISSLLSSESKLVTHDYIEIPASTTVEFYFSFTMSTDAGNDYQNLQLDFTNLYIHSVG